MSLERRVFAKEFNHKVLREFQAGKSTAQAANEKDLCPNLIAK